LPIVQIMWPFGTVVTVLGASAPPGPV